MAEPTCGTCPFYCSEGECRFEPPKLLFAPGSDEIIERFPPISRYQWCGKHPEINLESLIQRSAAALRDGDTPEDQAHPPALPSGQSKPENLEGVPRPFSDKTTLWLSWFLMAATREVTVEDYSMGIVKPERVVCLWPSKNVEPEKIKEIIMEIFFRTGMMPTAEEENPATPVGE